MKDEHEDTQEFLNIIPDNFDILEVGIDIQTQLEYIEYSHSFGSGKLTEKEPLQLCNILFDTSKPLKAKKKALTLLAHLGTINAFRQIEKYAKHPEKDLIQWTALALQECKMFLESTLSDESAGFISNGLGGLQNKMRFYFLILPSSDIAFTRSQKNTITEELNLAAKNMNSVVESIHHSEKFVGLTVLIPMDVAVGPFIDTVIKNCNELGDFLFEHYYVTNQNIPNISEINEIIKIVKE